MTEVHDDKVYGSAQYAGPLLQLLDEGSTVLLRPRMTMPLGFFISVVIIIGGFGGLLAWLSAVFRQIRQAP